MKKTALGLLSTLIFLLALFVFWKSFHHAPQVSVQSNAAQSKLPGLDGTMVEPSLAHTRPLGVVIENHPDSRPQSGLSSADIVYETLAEGGITRFLALFQTQQPHSLGPVRSARPYFADIANEYGAVFVHVGGSDEALSGIDSGRWAGISDANQYFNGDFFQRTARPAPHNVYTSYEKLESLIDFHRFSNTAKFSPWLFGGSQPQGPGGAEKVDLNFSTEAFAVEYHFNPRSGLYERFLAGKPHIDAQTGQQIMPQTVIVQYVTVTAIPNDPKLRVAIDLTSGGQSLVFSGGQAISATWKKDANGKTRFYKQDGNEIMFNPGQIWVELVPRDGQRVAYGPALAPSK